MKTIKPILLAALPMAACLPSLAQSPEVEELKAKMKSMEQSLTETRQRLAELEQKQPRSGIITTGGIPGFTIELPLLGIEGNASPIFSRRALNDQQEGAQRPNDLTLDPKYNGYIQVPNTPVLMKFNAKPRVDMMYDNRNSGNSDRFVTATIPLENDSIYGGGGQFGMNARGSQLSLDVRAPELPGDFRFYYQNDFFGSGGGMSYRLKQLYGQFFNVTAGFTYSVFEDPDVWPDTVDYEGPNSVLFARQPTIRYLLPLNECWQINFGVQQPSADIDGGPEGSPFNGATANNQAPDGAINVRWENAKRGHVQLAGIVRYLGARAPGFTDDQNALGWGLNLSSGLKLFKRDSMQLQLTYGEGIFHFVNDNFSNNDAAFDESGDLTALPYYGVLAGYTHHWNDDFRSTASFGYTHLDNEPSQGPNAYHETYYASLNLIWQLRKRLSVGLEGLYGKKEVQSGDTGDVFRVQLGMVYSFFD